MGESPDRPTPIRISTYVSMHVDFLSHTGVDFLSLDEEGDNDEEEGKDDGALGATFSWDDKCMHEEIEAIMRATESPRTYKEALADGQFAIARDLAWQSQRKFLPSTYDVASGTRPPPAEDAPDGCAVVVAAAAAACGCAMALKYACMKAECLTLALANQDAQRKHDTERGRPIHETQLREIIHNPETPEAQRDGAFTQMMALYERRGTKRKCEHLERFHHLYDLPLLQQCRWLIREAVRAHNCEDWGGFEYHGRYPKQRYNTPPGVVARRAQGTRLGLDMHFLECTITTNEDRAVMLKALNERTLIEIRALFEHEGGFYMIATGAPRLVELHTPVAEALLLNYLLEPTLEREMRKTLVREAKQPGSPLFTPRVVSSAIEAVNHPQAPTEVRDLALALLAEGDVRMIYNHEKKTHLFEAVPHIKSKLALVQLERIIARLEHPALKDWAAERDAAMSAA